MYETIMEIEGTILPKTNKENVHRKPCIFRGKLGELVSGAILTYPKSPCLKGVAFFKAPIFSTPPNFNIEPATGCFQ